MSVHRSLSFLLLGLLALARPLPASGEEIDFEEIPASNTPAAFLSDEYGGMGVQFIGSDGAIWQGVSQGDPGGFGIEGTNGPSFLGFDGGSFAMDLEFDAPVRGFRLDLTRGVGGSFHLFFTLMGMRDGVVVETVGATFGAVGEWRELVLTEEVDAVSWLSFGNYRYGIDNLRWEGDMASILTAEIDIMPGSGHNPLRLDRPGVVPVALFGAEDLDVTAVDPDSLGFGPEYALVAHRNGPHVMDVDGDGFLDLLAHFRVEESGLGDADDLSCLVGELLDGSLFEGCDAVTPVGRGRRGR